jgi:hypothetical protein
MGVLLNRFIEEMKGVIRSHSFEGEMVSVYARPLTPEEAIGKPEHNDYPLLKGKERIMEALFQGVRGHAYSDHTGNFSGTIEQVINLPMNNNFQRALLISTSNAVLRSLGIIKKSCHCKDDAPVKCAKYLVGAITRFSPKHIWMIGHQPRLLEEISRRFDVRITDRDPDNIGKVKSGILIEDPEEFHGIIEWADFIFATGTTIVNDTIDSFLADLPMMFYGITISGAANILGLTHFCPLGR